MDRYFAYTTPFLFIDYFRNCARRKVKDHRVGGLFEGHTWIVRYYSPIIDDTWPDITNNATREYYLARAGRWGTDGFVIHTYFGFQKLNGATFAAGILMEHQQFVVCPHISSFPPQEHPPGHAQNLPWPRKLKRLAKLSCTKISKRNGHAELIFGIHLKCANATIAPPSMKFPSVLLGCGG